MGLTLITPPANEPVTLDEAKQWLRLTNDREDGLIESLIRGATRHTEKNISKSLMTRTYRMTLDAFSDAIELLNGPVKSVSSVRYVDADGETQTVATDVYTVDLISSRQWIVRNSSSAWPTTINGVNAVSIDYVAGHDVLPAEFEDLKLAICLLVGHWKMHPEAVSGNDLQKVPLAYDALIQPYRPVMI